MYEPTPTTPAGLKQYDHLPAVEAVKAAWVNAGPNPTWHWGMKEMVRSQTPLLARALDRLAAESGKAHHG